MFDSSKKGINAYAKIGVETGVLAANPHQLIVMLFDGANIALQKSIQCIQTENYELKSKFISQAINIINDGLRASLNKKVGGEISENLDALYFYISNQIILGHTKNDEKILESAKKLLLELRDAWKTIGNTEKESSSTHPIIAKA
jgi:flagellar protein FliS